MARLGIDANLTFGSGSSATAGTGIKDLTCEVSANEVAVESRGYDFKRYLAGQKDFPIDFEVEADAPCVATLREAFWAGSDIHVSFSDAGGQTVSGEFVVTKFGANSPIAGEETYSVSIRPSANASSSSQPSHSTTTGSGT
ncbi:MAG: hypothetical protein IJM30_11245 [Thermoguttaceae bacterium]|nr:hypothetical protein [Thermoguttaceae bacterium]